MLPNQKGSYQARPTKWSVGKSKEGAVQFAVEFNLFGHWDGATWQQAECDITGYFYLVTKAGTINENTVVQVEDAFGWNRATGTNWLATAAELPDCQVFCDFEEYNGQAKIKVKWLNPFDRDPVSGLKESDPQEVKSIDNQYGNLFRGSARKTMSAPPAKPANGNGTPPAPPTSAPPSEVLSAQRSAWSAFKAINKGTTDEVADKWRTSIRAYFGKDAKLLTAQEWDSFRTDDFAKKVENPIGDEPVFADEEIPF